MRKKVTIVRAGNVGATLAQRITERDHVDVVMVDVMEGVPQGKALDLLDQLYYLTSRGLPPAEATAMIVGGLFESLMANIPEGLIRDRVRARVDARLTSA